MSDLSKKFVLTALILFWLCPAFARYGDDVLVRGEITGVDGKFVILALKRKLVMVPRGAIMKRYHVAVGEKVLARLPLKMVKLAGSRKHK
jgi:hypothetical protein